MSNSQWQEAAADTIEFIWLVGAIAVAVNVLWRSPPLSASRRRVGSGDTRNLLLIILSSGAFAFLATQSIYVQILGAKSDTDISDRNLVLMATAADAVAAAVMVTLTATLRRGGLRRVGIDLRHALVALVQGPAFLVVLYPIVLIADVAAQYAWTRFHGGTPPEHEMIKMLQETGSESLKWLIAVSAVVAAPVAEELFFRGYLQTLLREVFLPPWVAIVVSSVAFTAVHQPPAIWPVIFVLALGLGYIYERTGNLATTMVMHALFNGTQIWLVSHGG